jgi:hypothetical protein
MSGGIGGANVRRSPSDGQRQEILDDFKVGAAAVQSLSDDFGRVIPVVPENHDTLMRHFQNIKLRMQRFEMRDPHDAAFRDTREMLGLAAMTFLKQSSGLTDATLCVFQREVDFHGYSNVITAVELWNTGMPGVGMDDETGNIVAEDHATLLTWGNYFTFPCVPDTMCAATIKQRLEYLAMAASLCGYTLPDGSLFECKQERALAGGVVCAQFQITCMNFWLRRIGLIYHTADTAEQGQGLRLRTGDERAVLQQHIADGDEDGSVQDADAPVQDSAGSSESEAMSEEEDMSDCINDDDFAVVMRASAHDALWVQTLQNAQTNLCNDVSDMRLALNQRLLEASTSFLLYFGVPQFTMRALQSQSGQSGPSNIIRLAQLWDEPMLALQVRTVADRPVVYLDSKVLQLTWGDLFTFPRVRETMNPRAGPQRWGMLSFASEYSGAGVHDRGIFESAAGRAGLGRRVYTQIVTKCMLFWLAKLGRIYQQTQDGRFYHDLSDHVIMSRMEGHECNAGFTDMNAARIDRRAGAVRLMQSIAAADTALALEVAIRPADGTSELADWIDVRVRFGMETHGFTGMLYDWARENVGIKEILHRWSQPVPFLVEHGDGRRGAANLTPAYLKNLVVGDILVWPMPQASFTSSNSREGPARLSHEGIRTYKKRRQAIIMLARAFAVPFLQATADAGQVPAPGLITEMEFGTGTLNSNSLLYAKCQKLLMWVVCGRVGHADDG